MLGSLTEGGGRGGREGETDVSISALGLMGLNHLSQLWRLELSWEYCCSVPLFSTVVQYHCSALLHVQMFSWTSVQIRVSFIFIFIFMFCSHILSPAEVGGALVHFDLDLYPDHIMVSSNVLLRQWSLSLVQPLKNHFTVHSACSAPRCEVHVSAKFLKYSDVMASKENNTESGVTSVTALEEVQSNFLIMDSGWSSSVIWSPALLLLESFDWV